MAFENFTAQLLARAAETHDPGSADAYLRLGNAAEVTLKLIGWCLISEAVYRYGSEPAKKIVTDVSTVTGRRGCHLDVGGRLPEECDLARRLTAPPNALDTVLDCWTRIDELLANELGVTSAGVTKRKSLRWRHALRFLPFVRNKVKGHGAPPSRIYQHLNPLLQDLVQTALTELVAPMPPALVFLRTTQGGHGLFSG